VVAEHGDALYVECSADADVGLPDGPDLMDREQWRRANPSYPLRTPEASMLRMRVNLTNDDSWRREALGVWDTDGVTAWPVIGRSTWEARAIGLAEVPVAGRVAFGVKFSADGERVGVGVAVQPEVGPCHVEALGVRPVSAGLVGVEEWLVDRARSGAMVLLDGKAGTGDLLAALVAAGAPRRRVRVASTDEAITADASGAAGAGRAGAGGGPAEDRRRRRLGLAGGDPGD
jgi:hypothetical protein